MENLDKLRLVILFALRYSGDHKVQELVHELEKANVKNVQLVDMVMKYAGDGSRKLGTSKGGIGNWFANVIKASFKEIPNVFTQHKSLMFNVVQSILEGKLEDLDYRSTTSDVGNAGVNDIVVFIVGGATYQEAKEIHELKQQGHSLLLGGTRMHNSKSFLADIIHLYETSGTGAIKGDDFKSF